MPEPSPVEVLRLVAASDVVVGYVMFAMLLAVFGKVIGETLAKQMQPKLVLFEDDENAAQMGNTGGPSEQSR